MISLGDRLRETDPLIHDPQFPEDARDRIRRTVVGAALLTQPEPRGIRNRRSLALGAAALMVVVVLALVIGPGTQAPLHAAIRFEVRLAETQPLPGLLVARVSDSGAMIYLHPELVVTNDDIAQSWVSPDGPDHFAVSIELVDGGAERLRQATAAHLGRPVAMVIDGQVVTAPVVRSAIGKSALISGHYTEAAAERIATGIGVR